NNRRRWLWVPAFAGTTKELDPATENSTMSIADKLVLQRQHHLKWGSFDRLELILMMICGVLCFGFSLSVTADIVTRTIGHPWLWLQEVTSRSEEPRGGEGCRCRGSA